MSRMNLAEWPVECLDEYEGVIFDVTRFEGENKDEWIYCVLINFLENSSDKEQGPTGFTIITGIVEKDLRSIKQRIDTLISSGFLDDVTVSGQGTLFDDKHEQISEILWNSLDDDTEDDDIEITHTAPPTIQ